MPEERVRHIMTEAVLSIDIHEPITEVMRLFASYPVHHLPVVDAGQVKGMLSSADMLKLEGFVAKAGAMATASFLNERFKIATLMRQPVIRAKPGDSIEDAASRMVTHAIHSLPVVDEDDSLVGIITTTDIMYALLHGMGLKRAKDSSGALRKPTELEMRGALKAAESAILEGADEHAVAGALLYLRQRNERLEELRRNVARYLHGGAGDSQLHARLMKDINWLGEAGRERELMI